MKKFVSENWYKLMIGSSLIMASFGFMVYSVSPAMAYNRYEKFKVNSNYSLIPTNTDGSINFKLSDEQLKLIRTPIALPRVIICGEDGTPFGQGTNGGLQVFFAK